jgi:hypothetical protein
MTRFDAATPENRRKLFAEAITAHRERASPFVTFEAHADSGSADEPTGGSSEGTSEDADADALDEGESTEVPPWVQFADGTLNLDCTDAELEALKRLLSEFPAFKIDDLTRPEEAEGVNVRVSALADPNRVSQCVERVFREVYDQPEDVRAWVAEV